VPNSYRVEINIKVEEVTMYIKSDPTIVAKALRRWGLNGKNNGTCIGMKFWDESNWNGVGMVLFGERTVRGEICGEFGELCWFFGLIPVCVGVLSRELMISVRF